MPSGISQRYTRTYSRRVTYYYQRLIGALLGFFFVGPAVTIILAGALGGAAAVGTIELLLGAIVGAVVGAYTAGRIAAKKDRRARV